MQWFMANWQAVLVCILAIDQALIPIFPQVTVFQKIKALLASVNPKP